MIKKIIVGSFMLIPMGMAVHYYHGFNKTYIPEEAKLQPQSFIYRKTTTAARKNLNVVFTSLEKDFSQALTQAQFPLHFTYGTIFFNDLRHAIDSTKDNDFVGAFFDPAKKDIVYDIIKAHPEYAVQDIPELKTCSVKIPYKSFLSTVWLSVKIHPELRDFVQTKEEAINRTKQPIIDLYIRKRGSYIAIESHAPYGENSNKIMPSKGL